MLHLDRSTWRRVRFGDVVRNVNESVKAPEAAGIDRVLGLDNLDGGELEITHWGEVADGTTFTRRVRPGQTLFGKRRAYQRKTAYATFDAICSGDILVFEPTNQEVLLPELLPFLAMTDAFYDHAVGTSAGSLSPRTKWADLAKYEFDLPPIDQQRRIADLLWALENDRRARAVLLRRLTLARSAWVVRRLRDFPASSTHFGELWVRSPDSGCSAPPKSEDTGHRVLSLASLTDEGFRHGQVKFVDVSSAMRAAVLNRGDLLVSRSNTVDAVGRAAIYPDATDDVSFPDTMMRLHLDRGKVLPEFAVLVLMSPLGRRHMRRTAAGTSSSMLKINRRSLATMSFPSVELEDQKVILLRVRDLERAVGAQRAALGEQESLTASMLTVLGGGSNALQ